MRQVQEMVANVNREIKRVIALGFFDGAHIGHQALLKKMRSLCTGSDVACAYTFQNHPSSFFAPQQKQEYICSFEEKIKLLKKYGADEIISPVFDENIANISADDFAHVLFAELSAKAVVVGKNYRFGKGAQGTPSLLQKLAEGYGAQVYIVDTVELCGGAVSSTRIRKALAQGDVQLAGEMLARPFSISGTVAEGKKLGRTIGIPTANIISPDNRALPMDGVYAGRVFVGGEYRKAVVNIGKNPTVQGKMRTIESHMPYFCADIYGEQITVEFLRKIRGEIKFDSVEKLKEQIQRDILELEAE